MFPSERHAKVLWAGVEPNADLTALHRTIGTALADAIGFRPEERPYSPRITLARLDDPAPPEVIDRYLEDNRGFVIPSGQIDRFILYSSRFVDNVPKYQEEAVYPLAAAATHDGKEGEGDAGAERITTRESDANDGQLPEPTWRPQFSLRSILVLTFAVAVWLSICRIVPHIAVFLLGIILAAGATHLLVRLKKKVRGCRLRRLDRLALAVLWTLTLLSWAFFYVVSIGPVVAVAHQPGTNEPLKLFYAPVIWLHEHTPLAKPLDAYSDAWGWH